MSEYIRSTRECPVDRLHPQLLQALETYSQSHEVGNWQAETRMCCETVSRKKRTGRLASWLSDKPDTIVYTATLLTPQWLIWVQHGERAGTRVNAARLSEIQAGPYTSPFGRDAGLEIVGYIGGSGARVRGYIGMGTDLAAQRFCEEVSQAIRSVNPPPKKDLSRWWTG